jgi:hypothetical protein
MDYSRRSQPRRQAGSGRVQRWHVAPAMSVGTSAYRAVPTRSRQPT